MNLKTNLLFILLLLLSVAAQCVFGNFPFAFVAFPTNLARGEAFDVDKTKPINDSSEVTIRFKCFAAEYNDPILLNELNQFVLMFNDDMYAMWKKEKNHNMEKIPKQFLHIFSNWAYPFINLDTKELEWYVDKSKPYYSEIVKILQGK
jgi:hypothetical protein